MFLKQNILNDYLVQEEKVRFQCGVLQKTEAKILREIFPITLPGEMVFHFTTPAELTTVFHITSLTSPFVFL